VDVPEGQFITATTFKGHRSSEFSACIAVSRDTDGDGVPDPVEDAAPSDGDGNADGTPDRLSLREAIIQANLHAGRDRVEFNIPEGSGWAHTIRPTSPLPVITDPIIIDGYSQPRSTPATADERAVLPIALLGNLLDPDAQYPPHSPVGLHITAGHSLVQGLVIDAFRNSSGGTAILLQTVGGNVIQGNFIGTDVTGTLALGNGANANWPCHERAGIQSSISQTMRVIVGGVSPGAGNLISGNGGDGIRIYNNPAGHLVQGSPPSWR